MDITAVTTYLSGPVTAAIVAVGGVILILAVTAKGFGWVRRMLGR